MKKKEIPRWEIRLNKITRTLLAQEPSKELAPLVEVFIETCIENGCRGRDLLEIGGNILYSGTLLMLKKEIPKDKVMAHMDEIYSCVKEAFEKYE